MRLKDIVTEGLSPVLYHFTSFDNAIYAIEANNMFGEDSLSLTRSIAGQFHRDSSSPGALFKINGRKLSHTHKGSPVGDWRYDDDVDDDVRDNPIYKKRDILGDTIYHSAGKEDQYEEQIDKPIKDLKKVTELIYVFVPEKESLKYSIDDIDNFYNVAKSHGYNVKFIIGKDMLNASGAKSLSYEQFMQYYKEDTNPQLKESKYKYSSKSGKMEYDDTDPDQRHGIYVNNKLIQTYNSKEEADNVVKADKRFKNGIVKKIIN